MDLEGFITVRALPALAEDVDGVGAPLRHQRQAPHVRIPRSESGPGTGQRLPKNTKLEDRRCMAGAESFGSLSKAFQKLIF